MKDEILIEVRRKLWRPSKTSNSIVITIPNVKFFNEGEIVNLKVTLNKKVVIEKLKKSN